MDAIASRDDDPPSSSDSDGDDSSGEPPSFGRTLVRPVPLEPAPVERGELVLGDPDRRRRGVLSRTTALAHLLRGPGLRRGLDALLRADHAEGFANPNGAWPTTTGRGPLSACPNDIRAVADETTRARADRAFFAANPVHGLWSREDRWLNDQGRLTEPMILREGAECYEPIGWDEAFAHIARAFDELHGPDEAFFYTSGRTSNEAAYLLQLFARQLGTNNLGGSADLCQGAADRALQSVLGPDYPTADLEDLEHADTIVLCGINPGTTQPKMLRCLERAKRRGATLVALNPIRESGLAIADIHLQSRVGSDTWTFLALTRALLERAAAGRDSVLDRAFLESHTEGFEGFDRALRSIPWAELLAGSGLSRADVERAADALAQSEGTVIAWGTGLTQHPDVAQTMRAMVQLLLLGGHMGRRGAGLCPVHGHSNAAGVDAMGAHARAPEALEDAIGREFGFLPPRKPGLDTPAGLRAMAGKMVRVFVGLGGNLLSAAPDTAATARALRGCRLTVHVATKLNRTHLAPGHTSILLPCLGRSEIDGNERGRAFVSVIDGLGTVRASTGHLAPISEHLRGEPWIVANLAARVLGTDTTVPWLEMGADYDTIRDHIERTVPGFGQFNHRIRQAGGFVRRRADNGNAHLLSGEHPLTLAVQKPEPPGDGFMLTSVRGQGQRGTTIYDLDDPGRGVRGSRRVLFVNAQDMQSLGLHARQLVTLETRQDGGMPRRAPDFAVVPCDIARGCVATYFPEANALIEPGDVPPSKGIPVTIHVS